MEQHPHALNRLSWRERRALRAVLTGATAAAGRPHRDRFALEERVRRAPIRMLPEGAALHRVSGSVLSGLEGVGGVAEEVRRRLRLVSEESALRHLLTVGGLSEIASAFDAAGISWVVMKGPVLAGHLYPAAGERSYGDIDLLVDRGDFPGAVHALEKLGYRHMIRNWALAEEMLAGQIELRRGALAVDLHWHLHYSLEDRRPFAFDVGAMLARARSCDVGGLVVPTFDPVDTLLTLCFHAARSDGHRLVWLKDIERAITVDRPSLSTLEQRARAAGCAPLVGVMLARARRILDVDVPPSTFSVLAPAPIRATATVIEQVRHPVQFDESPTVTRAFTRSIRSSTQQSLRELPSRSRRRLRTTLRPQPDNETDDPAEKRGYLEAVTGSSEQEAPA